MTDQTETARELLWRHQLPEDVIDGALALHAQELAAVQRAAISKTDDPVFYEGEAGWLVNLIEPGGTEPAAASVVPAPATDQAALRDRIADALYAHDHPSHLVPLNETGMQPAYQESADAVMGVLRGLTLRELEQLYRPNTPPSRPEPRRVADEAQQPEAVCVCGHPEQQHFEDVCLTECSCGDFLTGEAAAEVRARTEGAIHALRSAAEHARVGVAVGPIPLEVRPAVAAWLCRLAEQRLDRARRDAAAVQQPKEARP